MDHPRISTEIQSTLREQLLSLIDERGDITICRITIPCPFGQVTFQLLDGLAIRGGYAGIGAPDPDARLIDTYFTMLTGDLSDDDGPGTFDPGYVLYATGRLMLLKLRDDLRAREGSKFSLKSFHDRLLGQGSLPLWLHRTLLLGDTGDDVLD